MLRSVLLIAANIAVVMSSYAQVELIAELAQFDNVDNAPIQAKGLSAKQENIADFMLLMNRETEFCTDNLGADPDDPAIVCVFEDTESQSEPFIFVDGDTCTDFVVFFNGKLVSALSGESLSSCSFAAGLTVGGSYRKRGIQNLTSGTYEVYVIGREHLSLYGRVEITVSDSQPVELRVADTLEVDRKLFQRMSDEHWTIAKYLYQENHDESCIPEIPPNGISSMVVFCAFEDPRTNDIILLYTIRSRVRQVATSKSSSLSGTEMIIFYDDELIGVIDRFNNGIVGPAFGTYEVVILYNRDYYEYVTKFGTISFTLPETSKASD